MDSKNFVPVSGLNDLSESALLTARSLISAAKNVKIYRSQCDELSRRCLDLASSLRDHSQGLEGTLAQQAIDEVERVLRNILKRVHKWADLGKMKSFVQQTEIRLGLYKSYRELQSCSVRFNIALHLHASHRNNELEDIRRRDHHELVEMIKKVLSNKQLLKMELAGGTPEAAQDVVQAIEQELATADVEEAEEQQLREDIGELRRWVERLPPLDDLSGKVVLTNNQPIATGGSQDIYTGKLTGQMVALACPRNQSHAEQERFQRQVEIWRTLRHPNILPLLGMARIDDIIYSVSPYVKFCNALGYLKCYPEADRVFLLREIASATEYLHMHGIIHGDLQGSNILISEEGHACLGDFGSARVEEGPIPEAPTYRGIRWTAPELITDRAYAPTTRATDVWSFGMLCIEIFTENVPYSEVPNEMFIPVVIGKGLPPLRPGNSATARGLSDAMWDLMNQCWQLQPTSRPSMTKVREVSQSHSFQVTMAPLAEIDNRVREAHQQREFAQLDDLTVRSLEEVQTNSRNMPPAEQQWTEPLSPAEAGHGNQPSSQPTIPPRPKPRDLTGKVSIISQQPDIKGSLLDFYLGEWESGEEQAILGCPKDQPPASQLASSVIL
ncbi:kinase-like domain-containing protein [Lactifluus volemus]|nr:kinase-like domain-containing protein [Lactifluus volemus]